MRASSQTWYTSPIDSFGVGLFGSKVCEMRLYTEQRSFRGPHDRRLCITKKKNTYRALPAATAFSSHCRIHLSVQLDTSMGADLENAQHGLAPWLSAGQAAAKNDAKKLCSCLTIAKHIRSIEGLFFSAAHLVTPPRENCPVNLCIAVQGSFTAKVDRQP